MSLPLYAKISISIIALVLIATVGLVVLTIMGKKPKTMKEWMISDEGVNTLTQALQNLNPKNTFKFNLEGNVKGDVTGNVKGDTATFSSSVTSPIVKGDVTGNVTGNVTGKINNINWSVSTQALPGFVEFNTNATVSKAPMKGFVYTKS